ncbi:hypothetical protein LTR75_002746 [Friedmanniomyces endolithicus]|nr:hypothetical protein LTR75_002746 [Friedmanniomyces endolithicus]
MSFARHCVRHFNGFTGSWGVIQSHLLQTSLPDVPTSTITFVGSLATAATVAFGLASVRLTRLIGARLGAVAGVTLLGLAQVLSGFTTSQVGGLFGLSGVMVGLGMSLLYTINNTLPTQYFSSRLGTANGLIKFGGGIGATVLAIVVELLIERVGIPWTFRIIGFITLSTGIPAALLLKERTRGRNAPFLELAMFRNPAYTAVFIAAALGAFTLFAPPYFLPLIARSVGLSSTTGAGLVAGFNACTAIGRLVSGPTCDRIGPTNTFLITMLLSAVSMLAIWPFSSNLPLLAVFVVLNGIANGSFFVTMPTVAAAMFGPERAPVAMSQAVTGWTVGYLVGPPIAGYLIQATVRRARACDFLCGGIGAGVGCLCPGWAGSDGEEGVEAGVIEILSLVRLVSSQAYSRPSDPYKIWVAVSQLTSHEFYSTAMPGIRTSPT